MARRKPGRRSLLKTYPNLEGVVGWAGSIGFNLERYLYTLHRVTGYIMFIYLLLHVFVTSSRAFGPEAWAAAMGSLSGPLFHIGEFILFLVVLFHGANGIRLFLAELGLGLGRPARPVYPYRPAFRRLLPKVILYIILAIWVVFFALGYYDWFILGV